MGLLRLQHYTYLGRHLVRMCLRKGARERVSKKDVWWWWEREREGGWDCWFAGREGCLQVVVGR